MINLNAALSCLHRGMLCFGVFGCAHSILHSLTRNPNPNIFVENRELSSCQLCHNGWHRRLSWRKLPVMTKLVSWWFSGLRARPPTKRWILGASNTMTSSNGFSALLAICAGNSPVTGEFPPQRPVTQSFDVFFDLCLNKRLSKHNCEAGDLRRQRVHYDVTVMKLQNTIYPINYGSSVVVFS